MPVINSSSNLRLGTADPQTIYVGTQQIWSRGAGGFTESFSGGDAGTWPAAWQHTTKPYGAAATVSGGAGALTFSSQNPWTIAGSTYICTSTFTIADCDMTCRVLKGTAAAIVPRVILRDVSPGRDGSVCVRVSLNINTVGVYDMNGWSSETYVSEVGYSFNDNTWYGVRVRIQGRSIRVKVWPSAQVEPTSWLINATLTTQLPAGRLGFQAAGGTWASRTTLIDDIVVSPL